MPNNIPLEYCDSTFVRSLVRSFVRSFVGSIDRSLLRPFIQSFRNILWRVDCGDYCINYLTTTSVVQAKSRALYWHIGVECYQHLRTWGQHNRRGCWVAGVSVHTALTTACIDLKWNTTSITSRIAGTSCTQKFPDFLRRLCDNLNWSAGLQRGWVSLSFWEKS